MSLGIVVKSPSGIVMAADSRVTLEATTVATGKSFPVYYDNAIKLLRFNDPHGFVAAVTFGQAVIPGQSRTAESFLPELDAHLSRSRLTVEAFAQEVSDFYVAQWPTPLPTGVVNMVFYVGGFDEGEPYGRVFKMSVPDAPTPEELNAGGFGISWGGQQQVVDRILKGHDLSLASRLERELALDPAQQAIAKKILDEQGIIVPVNIMALQDCVDLAITLVRTTISVQQLSVQQRGVGGPVDVVTITRTDGVKVVQFKTITGDVSG